VAPATIPSSAPSSSPASSSTSPSTAASVATTTSPPTATSSVTPSSISAPPSAVTLGSHLAAPGGTARSRMEVPRQKKLVEIALKENQDRLVELLLEDHAAKAWWVSSCFSGSGNILTSATQSLKHLSADGFRSAISMRLLLPKQLSGPLFVCSACNSTQDPENEDPTLDPRYHRLSCTQCQLSRSGRHTSVQNSLTQLLMKLYGDGAVSINPTIGTSTRKADIKLQT